MKLSIFQIDAFAEDLFKGNPAAVIPLKEWLPDAVMQNIAAENNLSETAFFIPSGKGFHIRWFTPANEVNLCGHATLATAHVLFNHLGFAHDELSFQSKSGLLKVRRINALIELDFPSSQVIETDVKESAKEVFGINPLKCFKGREDTLFLFQDEEQIRYLKPDIQKMKSLETRGIIVTAPSGEVDFVSRFFAPSQGIDEDPVTGSAHTMLIPYWSEVLGKKEMVALQLSRRGGKLHCRYEGERVKIAGKAITFLRGKITL